MSYLQRLTELDRLIRSGQRLGPKALAEKLGVTTRQIQYDREALLDLGAPLVSTGRRGWYYSQQTWRLPGIFLTEGELLALFLSVEIARSSGSATLDADLQKAITKIVSSLGNIVSADLNMLHTSTSYAPAAANPIDAGFYLDLYHAATHGRKVYMEYDSFSSNNTGPRIVHPYHLHYTQGNWLLIAFDESHNKIRNFNIRRINRLRQSNDRFTRQLDFDPTEYIRKMLFAEAGDEMFTIQIHFDEYQAKYIRERTWHPEQHLENLPEGGAILTFPSSGLNEVARWVLGYGRHACVVGPPELVEIVRSHLQGLTELYDTPACQNV